MFVTYKDLNDMRDGRKRSQINGFVNRGRKANRAKLLRQQERPLKWQARTAVRTSTTPTKLEPEALVGSNGVVAQRDVESADNALYGLMLRHRPSRHPLQYGLGGLRKNSFGCLPTAQTGQIEWATDFCEHYAPLFMCLFRISTLDDRS
jgi:hypothetical protein